MSIRKTAVVILLAILTVSSAFAQKTTINFWTWRPEDVETYDKLIAIFEKANPGITVVQTANKSTEYNTILSAALSGGSGPDVF